MNALFVFLRQVVELLEQHTGPVTSADGCRWDTTTWEMWRGPDTGGITLEAAPSWVNHEHVLYACTQRWWPSFGTSDDRLSCLTHLFSAPIPAPAVEQPALF